MKKHLFLIFIQTYGKRRESHRPKPRDNNGIIIKKTEADQNLIAEQKLFKDNFCPLRRASTSNY